TLVGRHRDQHDPYARHPVMTPDMIRQLPTGYALVIRGGMSPVIARLPMAWKDPAYKRARRYGHSTSSAHDRPSPPEGVVVPRPRLAWRDWDDDPADVPAAPDDVARYPWQ